jgi:hypothetical protein
MRAPQSPITLGAKRFARSSKIASISDNDPLRRFRDDWYIRRVAGALRPRRSAKPQLACALVQQIGILAAFAGLAYLTPASHGS